MVAYLHLQSTLDNDVELLAVVRAELDGRILLLGNVGELDKEGLCELILELGGQVVVLDAVLLQDLQTVAASGNGEGGQRGASTLQKVDHLDVARLGALVNKGKAEVCLTLLKKQIVLDRNTGQLCQLCGGIALCLS